MNNYESQVAIGEQRYVESGLVQGAGPRVSQFSYVTANLTVKIKPLINAEGNINLAIDISIDSFTNSADPTDATRETKTIHTIANVGNTEVLAIGGLLRVNEEEATTKVPVLGDIPILGWFFKNKTKFKTKDNLLVFISPRIVEPKFDGGLNDFSQDKTNHAKNVMCEMQTPAERRDAIHRWFFKDVPCENIDYIDSFITSHNPPSTEFYSPYPEVCPGERLDTSTPCERLNMVDAHPASGTNGAMKKSMPQPTTGTLAKDTRKKPKSLTDFMPEDERVEA
jgi:general secretion pathway protein D